MKFIRNNKGITAILALSLLARLFFFFSYHPVWWDSASFLGMGKYIFSLGKAGFWEYTRPGLWPLILGFFWKLNLDPLLFGRILELLFSMAIIWLTYLTGKEIFDRKTALLSALIISSTPVFFFFGYRLYPGIPSTFLALLAMYFFIKKKSIVLSALLASAAFLARFPQGLIFFSILMLMAVVYFRERKYSIKDMVIFALAFSAPVMIYMLLHYIFYNAPLLPFYSGVDIVMNSHWVFPPWYFFIKGIIIESPVYLFALPGIFCILKAVRRKTGYPMLLLSCFLLPFIFFIMITHKELRFAILYLPYLAIITGYGILSVKHLVRKSHLSVLVILLLAFSAYSSIHSYMKTEQVSEDWIEREYYSFLDGKDIEGKVLVSNPHVGVRSDARQILLYYPMYSSALAEKGMDYMAKNRQDIDYVLFDTCLGGTECNPADRACGQKKELFIKTADSLFTNVYFRDTGRCRFYIWESIYTHGQK